MAHTDEQIAPFVSDIDDVPNVTPSDVADGICVHQLGGGLGNQLFEYAAGLAQARRLNCPLYIDISAFRTYAARRFELGALGLPGTLVDLDFPRSRDDGSVGLRHRFSRRLPPLSRQRLARTPVFRPTTADFDPGIDSVTPGTTLSGYFQSARYFSPVVDEMFSHLRSALSRAIGDSRMFVPGFVSVHIRRGDYLDPRNMASLGLAGPGYFRAALRLLRRDPTVPTRHLVFTDSPNLIGDDFAPGRTEMFDAELKRDTLSTLAAMSEGDAIVMSNSSFSWWAAWMMRRRDPDCWVIAPRPWHANRAEESSDLLPPTWVTVDRRM